MTMTATDSMIDDAELVALAQGLARTPSESGHEGDAVRLVVGAMERLGFEAVRIDAAGNAIGEIGRGDGRRLLIDGHDVVRDPVAAKAALAYVPDDPNLFESLTVWEHLRFIASAYRVGSWSVAAEALLERQLREPPRVVFLPGGAVEEPRHTRAGDFKRCIGR